MLRSLRKVRNLSARYKTVCDCAAGPRAGPARSGGFWAHAIFSTPPPPLPHPQAAITLGIKKDVDEDAGAKKRMDDLKRE